MKASVLAVEAAFFVACGGSKDSPSASLEEKSGPKVELKIKDHTPVTPMAVFPDMVLVPKRLGVAPFYMDKREVTVRDYEDCVKVGVCNSPSVEGPCAAPANNWASKRITHPVNCVSAVDVWQYCRYREKRLPSFEEFSAAAFRDDKAHFPWGAEQPTCERAVLSNCGVTSTLPGGSRPSGSTADGIDDLIGNVGEVTGTGPNEPFDALLNFHRGATARDSGVFGGGYATSQANGFLRDGTDYSVRLPSAEVGIRCASSMPGKPQVASY